MDLSADVSSVDAHLDMLRPAIASYGAKVEVRRPYRAHTSSMMHASLCFPKQECALCSLLWDVIGMKTSMSIAHTSAMRFNGPSELQI